jgi:hypothetical protein
LGALGFDSAGFWAGFESAVLALDSDFEDVASDDFPSDDLPSLAFDSPEALESPEELASPPLPASPDDPDEPLPLSPLDAGFRDAF